MALKNNTPNTPINHPSKEGVLISGVHAAYLLVSQISRTTTNVSVELYRELGEGEVAPFSRMEGYVQIAECGPHNLGEAPTTGNLSTYWQDVHDFAISVLGSNFTKI